VANQLIETMEKPKSAVIVGVTTNSDGSEKLASDLDELELLLDTLGISCTGRVMQRRQRFDPRSLLGSGKVEEIVQKVTETGASIVAVDRLLSPPQLRNLEKMTGCEVMDRTGVILEIFSRHAHTNQAKIQVEIARLEYLLPRLAGAWTHFQRQKGATLQRGMGEKQIEVDRRRARERIGKLQKQLEQIRRERQTQRKARSDELKVAIVGYTNSGKTTLMKGLTRSAVEGKNELFATLDTSIKTLDPRTHPKILMSDTVGFIQNLPHSLVESFKSTLEEVCEADLLLNVVDVSYYNYQEHIETTNKVLQEIGAGEVPKLMVFNKIDRLEPQERHLPRILKGAYKGSIALSAFNESDLMRLRKHIYDYFRHDLIESKFTVGVTQTALQSQIYGSCLILDVDYSQEGVVVFTVQATAAATDKIKSLLEPAAGNGEQHD
jgi:GTP-binding protein HflX